MKVIRGSSGERPAMRARPGWWPPASKSLKKTRTGYGRRNMTKNAENRYCHGTGLSRGFAISHTGLELTGSGNPLARIRIGDLLECCTVEGN
jgi:hypothetical protein